MKKLWRRILLLAAMLVMALGVHAFADTRDYVAEKVFFPNNANGKVSNVFTFYDTADVSIAITLENTYNNDIKATINQNLRFVLQNVDTGAYKTFTGPNNYSTSYTLETTVPAGRYQFGVYYSASSLTLYYRVSGTTLSSGISIQSTLEVALGNTATVPLIVPYGATVVAVSNCVSSDSSVAVATSYDNSVVPPTVTVYGKKAGTCTLTVYGADGSSAAMTVTVKSYGVVPVLQHKELTIVSGGSAQNTVLNSVAPVTWSTTNAAVATVNSNGMIYAKNPGKATIIAATQAYGTHYNLACQVTVTDDDGPDFTGRIISVSGSGRTVVIGIRNDSDAPMKVFSSGARLYTVTSQGLTPNRYLKMKSGKSYTIPDGKYKKITFKIKGSKTDALKGNSAVRVKFKVNGKTYFAMLYSKKTLCQYILKANIGTNNWLYTTY